MKAKIILHLCSDMVRKKKLYGFTVGYIETMRYAQCYRFIARGGLDCVALKLIISFLVRQDDISDLLEHALNK